MAEILDKMVSADVIVMATPVYFYSMNGQMKTLIDRTVPRYEEISGKDFYFIVAAADTSHANMEKRWTVFADSRRTVSPMPGKRRHLRYRCLADWRHQTLSGHATSL